MDELPRERLAPWHKALAKLSLERLLELFQQAEDPCVRAWAENLYRHGQRVEARF